MTEHIDITEENITSTTKLNVLPKDSIKAFYEKVVNEDTCRRWLLELLRPDGTTCPKCKNKIADETTVKNFWSGRRCTCKHCGKKFYATHGSILAHSSFSMRQIAFMIILIALDISNKQIADIIGIHPDSVRLWRMNING